MGQISQTTRRIFLEMFQISVSTWIYLGALRCALRWGAARLVALLACLEGTPLNSKNDEEKVKYRL